MHFIFIFQKKIVGNSGLSNRVGFGNGNDPPRENPKLRKAHEMDDADYDGGIVLICFDDDGRNIEQIFLRCWSIFQNGNYYSKILQTIP